MNAAFGLVDLFAATRGAVVLQALGWPSTGAPWSLGGAQVAPPAPIGVQVRGSASAIASRAPALTPRETEVLQRIAKGFTLPEVAAQLGVSRHTAGDHVKAVYRKLSVGSRAEATLEAARLGLVAA
jgi:DNA-binding CsgD family transcriptional regulator